MCTWAPAAISVRPSNGFTRAATGRLCHRQLTSVRSRRNRNARSAGRSPRSRSRAERARSWWTEDERPREFNEEKLRTLKPAFGGGGTVTAGNASSINDGAAAVVVLSPDKAKELGVQPQARILGYATFSREPLWFTIAPDRGDRRADAEVVAEQSRTLICSRSTRRSPSCRWPRWPTSSCRTRR